MSETIADIQRRRAEAEARQQQWMDRACIMERERDDALRVNAEQGERLRTALARVKTLEAVVEADDLAFAELDDVPELNIRNYNEDQVIELSAAFCDAHLLMKQAREAVEETPDA